MGSGATARPEANDDANSAELTVLRQRMERAEAARAARLQRQKQTVRAFAAEKVRDGHALPLCVLPTLIKEGSEIITTALVCFSLRLCKCSAQMTFKCSNISATQRSSSSERLL